MSAILRSDDLNDFIKPGVACIKPVESVRKAETAEIAIGIDGIPEEEGRALAPAQISLQDCLACSGCVTSSEAALVELQSPKELLAQLDAARENVFVLSVCPQARASLSNAYRMSIDEVDARLKVFFLDRLKFRAVVGTEVGRILSLVESYREISNSEAKPVLGSTCPGWTLYTEKTHSEIVPFLSKVKSPQQITGHLLKHLFSEELGLCPKTIYHVSLMPCFDKKLESARPDFVYDEAREVDLVITPKELVDMLHTHFDTGFERIPTIANSANNSPRLWPTLDWKSNSGSSSGGYLDFILSSLAECYPHSRVHTVQGKNSDYTEFQLLNANDELLFKGAQVYGFKNIQNMVRKLKMKHSKAALARRNAKRASQEQLSDPSSYDYIEVMACPGGCIGGGGQIAPPMGVLPKEWINEVNASYSSIECVPVDEDLYARVLNMMRIGSNETYDQTMRDKMLYTHYKHVEPDSGGISALTVGTQW